MTSERYLGGRDVSSRTLCAAIVFVMASSAIAVLSFSAAPSASAYTVRGPIAIYSDLDFTLANGVVNGSGTAADPFVIEGWEILPGSNTGILIQNTRAHYVVQDCFIHDGYHYGIMVDNSFNGTFLRTTVDLCMYGAYMSGVRDFRVVESTFSRSYAGGLDLYACKNGTLVNNTLMNNDLGGIQLSEDTGITVDANRLFGDGIDLWGTELSHYTDNQITASNMVNGYPVIVFRNETGVSLSDCTVGQVIAVNCSLVTISNVTCSDCESAVVLAYSADALVQNCSFARHWMAVTADACPRLRLEGNSILNASLDWKMTTPIAIGIGVRMTSCLSPIVSNNLILHPDIGIEVYESDNATVVGNDVILGGYAGGIWVDRSDGVVVEGNNVTDKDGGISVGNSNMCTVANNTFYSNNNGAGGFYNITGLDIIGNDAIDNGGGGFLVTGCKWVNVTDNVLSGSFTLGAYDYGLEVEKGGNLRIINNTIASNSNGLSCYQLEDVLIDNNSVTDNLLMGVLIHEVTSNLTVSGNLISGHADIGLGITSSSPFVVTANEIVSNGDGAVVQDSQGEVSGNTISLNSNNGLWLNSACYVHGNHFALNSVRQAYDASGGLTVWNAPYPTGGNYWSDYSGVDFMSGPDQNVSGSDGKGDTPYEVSSGAWDYYPLVSVTANTPPTPAFMVSPAYGSSTTIFQFDASSSSDAEDPLGLLMFRWDYEDDGIWDVNWSSDPVTYHQFGSDGTYTVRLAVRDSQGQSNSTSASVEVSPPISTTLSISGSIGDNGWYVSSVSITLEGVGGLPGPATTEYKLDAVAWTPYTSPIGCGEEGYHALSYRSSDISGNWEESNVFRFRIDLTAPVTNASVSDEVLVLAPFDGTSGVQKTMYRVDGGLWMEFAGTVGLSGETNHTVQYYTVDKAGNSEEVKTLEVEKAKGAGFFGIDWWIVLLTIALIAALSIPAIFGMRRKAKESDARSAIKDIGTTVVQLQDDVGPQPEKPAENEAPPKKPGG